MVHTYLQVPLRFLLKKNTVYSASIVYVIPEY